MCWNLTKCKLSQTPPLLPLLTCVTEHFIGDTVCLVLNMSLWSSSSAFLSVTNRNGEIFFEEEKCLMCLYLLDYWVGPIEVLGGAHCHWILSVC